MAGIKIVRRRAWDFAVNVVDSDRRTGSDRWLGIAFVARLANAIGGLFRRRKIERFGRAAFRKSPTKRAPDRSEWIAVLWFGHGSLPVAIAGHDGNNRANL